MSANTSFSDSLTRANADLPQLRTSEEIRAVVLSLIDENRKVQVKIDELSKSLDELVDKFEKLRTNLADANDKAMRDALTGLGNRRFFDEELEMSLKSDPVVCLLMCDLDNFKGINDKFGHRGRRHGAQAIRRHPQRRGAARRSAARVGGEEFAMVMPNISPVEAGRLADHVRRQLEAKKWMVGERRAARQGHRLVWSRATARGRGRDRTSSSAPTRRSTAPKRKAAIASSSISTPDAGRLGGARRLCVGGTRGAATTGALSL